MGATSTRSRPRSSAAVSASSMGRTPSCSPVSVMTRTGLIRICRLTRVRCSRCTASGVLQAQVTQKKDTHSPDVLTPRAWRQAPRGMRFRTRVHRRLRSGWGWEPCPAPLQLRRVKLPDNPQSVNRIGSTTSSPRRPSATRPATTTGSCSNSTSQPPATASPRSARLLSRVTSGSTS